MNKILVVGHPLSDYEAVADLLNTNGMSKARPSKNEGMEPTEITESILKAHQYESVSTIDDASIKQLSVGPVWNGLALDLMLGNIGQEFWGWADTNAIALLDYWSSLDPELAFVLVYDRPEELLMKGFGVTEVMTPEDLQRVMEYWLEYNQTMLRFYHRNSERSILVHAQQISDNSTEYLQRVRRHMDVPLSIDQTGRDVADPSKAEEEQVPLDSQAEHADPVSEASGSLRSYLTQDFLQQHPDVLLLYKELQSVADLPLEQRSGSRVSTADAWSAVSQMSMDNQELLKKEQAQGDELRGWDTRLQESGRKRDELAKENELILYQMHHLQEEVERYHHENLGLKKKVSQISAPPPKPTGAAERVKQQLDYRLGAVMIEHARTLSGWMSMSSSLRDERARFLREMSDMDKKGLPPLSEYEDAHEAERVKKHLSYRLGVAMLENEGSAFGWFTLPWALRRALSEYRQDRSVDNK